MGERERAGKGQGPDPSPGLHWSLDFLASASESPGRFVKTPPQSLSFGWGLSICISKVLPGLSLLPRDRILGTTVVNHHCLAALLEMMKLF